MLKFLKFLNGAVDKKLEEDGKEFKSHCNFEQFPNIK